MPNLIDAHCHINFNAYKNDAPEVISRATEAGIFMIAPGSQFETSERAVEYASKYPTIWAAVGLHPIHLFSSHVDEEEDNFITRGEEFNPDSYRHLAKSARVVAIGECGLDYYRTSTEVPFEIMKQKQAAVFRAHCDLSFELGLPIMIHCRDAHSDILRILNDYKSKHKDLRGNIHCFTGTWDEAKQYLALGFYVSFTGVVTFPQKKVTSIETLTAVASKIPLDRILVETDAPYLSPVPKRGGRNEPSYVEYIVRHLAAARNLPYEELAEATVRNSQKLFGI